MEEDATAENAAGSADNNTKRTASGTSCLVQRTGLVTMTGPEGVTALINGRTLLLAAEKVEAGIEAGDTIVWNGNIWTASNGGAQGTSNMRKA